MKVLKVPGPKLSTGYSVDAGYVDLDKEIVVLRDGSRLTNEGALHIVIQDRKAIEGSDYIPCGCESKI